MFQHVFALSGRVVPCVPLIQFGHQGALAAFEKGDLDVLLSCFRFECVLRLFGQVGLNATSTKFQSQTSQLPTPAL